MKSISIITCISILFVLSFYSCKDESGPGVINKEKLSGFIQKGPFLNGTSISVSELNKDFSQTGKQYSSQIKDNQGTFELTKVQLSSPYVELKADGYYFNEVTGEPSKSQLTLYALADVSNISTLNVNVLSTLEKGRVEHLVAGGLSFADAKKKALEEILAIFSLTKSDIKCSETLDINKSGDDNAILLAISAILQGYRSEGELSELLANMSADISTDGKLNSETLGTALISHAKFLNATDIRMNLVARYTEIGATLQIPEFEKYIAQFIEKSTYKAVSLITYPESVDGLLNVLNEKNSTFSPDMAVGYQFSVISPKGTSLKIKLEYIEGGNPFFLNSGFWSFQWGSFINWKNNLYDSVSKSQIFEVIESGKQSKLKFYFMTGENLKVRISYFENNNEVATMTRIITVN